MYLYIVAVLVVVAAVAAAAWSMRARGRSKSEAPQPRAPAPRAPAVSASGSEEEDPDEESGPQRLILVNAVAMTDVGLKRTHNEDAYAVLDRHNLFAVADGMGMESGGEVASKLAIEAITDSFDKGRAADPTRPGSRRRRLVRAIEHANQVLRSLAGEVEQWKRMGTTVVAAWFSPSKQRAYIAHVGDSRCYRIRSSEIRQLTADHNLGALGVQGSQRSRLSRAVGLDPEIDVDVMVDKPMPGDVYVLCSDGLTKMVSDELILKTVREAPDLEGAVRGLIDRARDSGGRDNITTILVRVDLASQ